MRAAVFLTASRRAPYSLSLIVIYENHIHFTVNSASLLVIGRCPMTCCFVCGQEVGVLMFCILSRKFATD